MAILRKAVFCIFWATVGGLGSAFAIGVVLGIYSSWAIAVSGSVSQRALEYIGMCLFLGPQVAATVALALGIFGVLPGTRLHRRVDLNDGRKSRDEGCR